ncbi:vitamin K epoxide reductase family protein [Nafulsella turpanensis]|uniref:vitamin K epoxide reductase family protein n=1 Tax=Nafulsella turpanensis TaxID=1265690 RepID=UPI000347B316|nr:vitamin K epoxide reductase family protein [Nafulsella turpanensis]
MEKVKKTVVRKIQSRNDQKALHRRDIALLSAAGIIDFIPISLYQLGIIKHIPDFPTKIFDSDYVNASKEAQIAGVPDGPVSLLMYAANLVTIGAALKKKKRKNVFDYLVAANSIGQAAGGAFYLYNMATKQKKVCIYCVTGALLNFATLVPLKRLFFSSK